MKNRRHSTFQSLTIRERGERVGEKLALNFFFLLLPSVDRCHLKLQKYFFLNSLRGVSVVAGKRKKRARGRKTAEMGKGGE